MTLEAKIRKLLASNASNAMSNANYSAMSAKHSAEDAQRHTEQAQKQMAAAIHSDIDSIADRLTGLTFESVTGWLTDAGVELTEEQADVLNENISDELTLDDLDTIFAELGITLTEEQGVKVGEALLEAYPGFGRSQETEPPAQGSSQRPSFATIMGGRGAADGQKSAAPLAAGAGYKENAPPKQGNSADAEVEELPALEQGKAASAKAKKGPGIHTTGQIGTTKGQDITDVSIDPTASTGGVRFQEEVTTLFASETELSEEFKVKAASVFEAIVLAKVAEERERIETELTEEAARLIKEHEEKVEAAADQFLTESVNQWMKDNEPVLENNLKLEIQESFMQGLHQLFKDHFINIPDEQVNVVESLQVEIAAKNAEITAANTAKAELETQLNELKKEAVLGTVAEGLASTEIDKLRTLAEDVKYENDAAYKEKIEAIRKNFFKKGVVTTPANITTDDVDNVVTQSADSLDWMDKLVAAMPVPDTSEPFTSISLPRA